MARPREFHFDEALDRAVETFWSKGYEATSIQDLVDNMGIHRGSLYTAFGDKQSLFLRVMDRYREIVVRKLLDILEAEPRGMIAIRRLFEALVDHMMTGGPYRGCLVTNSAIERALHHPQTAKKVDTCLKQIEEGFYKSLEQAQAHGELNASDELRPLARYLTSSMQGILVVGKVRRNRASLEDIVAVILRALQC